ncbi:hypothetical protein BV898_06418 [Hypsibius exemplaris]|uniref:Uncharacterized protein n=1 Tax=Hypsibius exemplaris TaxID=2072580 RepID=A0A1W0WWV1_HYPEX|nr:hypothetical protein BV898_06418 [Hypsibius exemplaris]
MQLAIDSAKLRKRSWFRSAMQPWADIMEQEWTEDAAWWTAVLTREPPSTLNKKKDMKFWMNLSDRIQANISENGRLSFLQFLRTNFAVPLRSQFLDVLPRHQATPILKILTSEHHLRVETGRWVGLPKDEQNCNHCGELEDEQNILFKCFLFDDLQTTLCTLITEMRDLRSFIWETLTNRQPNPMMRHFNCISAASK